MTSQEQQQIEAELNELSNERTTKNLVVKIGLGIVVLLVLAAGIFFVFSRVFNVDNIDAATPEPVDVTAVAEAQSHQQDDLNLTVVPSPSAAPLPTPAATSTPLPTATPVVTQSASFPVLTISGVAAIPVGLPQTVTYTLSSDEILNVQIVQLGGLMLPVEDDGQSVIGTNIGKGKVWEISGLIDPSSQAGTLVFQVTTAGIIENVQFPWFAADIARESTEQISYVIDGIEEHESVQDTAMIYRLADFAIQPLAFQDNWFVDYTGETLIVYFDESQNPSESATLTTAVRSQPEDDPQSIIDDLLGGVTNYGELQEIVRGDTEHSGTPGYYVSVRTVDGGLSGYLASYQLPDYPSSFLIVEIFSNENDTIKQFLDSFQIEGAVDN